MKKPLLLLIPALFLITGCGEKPEPNPDHQHVFGDAWVFDSTNHWHECECGERKDSSPHTFSDDWKKDALKHWHECECGNKIDNENHIDIDNNLICDVCGQTLPMPPCPDNNHVDANEDMVCDICGYPVIYPHIESVSANYTAPFYLKVGEERSLHLEISPSKGVRSIEKIFTWDNPNKDVALLTPNENDSLYATIKGVKEGKAVVKATNTYNPELTRSITANVIDYDDENMYLWEYKSDDRKQFGYVNEEGKKAGVTDGTATLNGVEWDFHRSSALALNSQKGGLAFGKGFDQTTLRSYPETTVKLSTKNDRKVKKIVIETASANGLANINVKVGETEVLNRLTPSSSAEAVGSVSTGELDDLIGDISIEFTTPDFDETRVADEDYKRPGAVIIKSIFITYSDVEYKNEKQYDFIEMFNDPESEMSKQITSTSGKACVLEDDDFVINFNRVRKSDDKGNPYFESNNDITIVSKKNDEVIKYVDFMWEILTDSAPKCTLQTSVFNGELYQSTLVDSKTGVLQASIPDSYTNAIKFSLSSTSYIGLKSITVKTLSGNHLVVKDVKLNDDAKPNKVTYNEGEKFDSTGLGDVNITFTNDETFIVRIPSSSITFYDGVSYDADEKTEVLAEGTTFVVGLLLNHEIRVSGITVELIMSSFVKINSAEELVNGKYLFVIESSKEYWIGSSNSTDIKGTKGVGKLGDIEIGNELLLPSNFEKETISVKNTDGVCKLSHYVDSSEKKFGLTDTGNFSGSASKYTDWSVEVSEGMFNFSNIYNETTKYLIFNSASSLFNVGTSPSNNISLYKLAD